VHQSAHDHMALCIETYMPKDRHYRVLDLGARLSPGQKLTHRQLLSEHDIEYAGIDVQSGNNVDVVMPKPYRIPAPTRSVDVLLSGQVFEHIPFFWATMLEIARVLRPDGYAFITAPSRGHVHSTYDCWRYYPDGYRAMAAYSGLKLIEAHTDFPPKNGRRHDFTAIDPDVSYWGDSVGVFQKPTRYPHARAAVVRGVTRWWANRIGSLEKTPKPAVSAERKQVASPVA
jgi:SAM-dependent methyltransferase